MPDGWRERPTRRDRADLGREGDAPLATDPTDARHRRVRDQRVRRHERGRRRRRGARGEHARARGGLRRAERPRDVHARRRGRSTQPAGTVVFIRDPTIVRHARADEPGTQVLAVGGPRDARVRAVALGGLLRGHPPPQRRGLRRVSRRAGGRSRAAPRSPGDALQRRVARRRSSAGRTTRSRHPPRARAATRLSASTPSVDDDFASLRERAGLAELARRDAIRVEDGVEVAKRGEERAQLLHLPHLGRVPVLAPSRPRRRRRRRRCSRRARRTSARRPRGAARDPTRRPRSGRGSRRRRLPPTRPR